MKNSNTDKIYVMKNMRILLLAGMLCACMSTLMAATTEAITTLSLVSGTTTEYKIVYQDGNTTAQSNAEEFQKAIQQKTNVTIPIVSDATTPTAKEIILGATNARAEHAIIRGSVPKYGYRLAVIDQKLVITASDANHMVLALKCFEKKILANTSLANEGKLTFATNHQQYGAFAETQASLREIIKNDYECTLTIPANPIFKQVEHLKDNEDTYAGQGTATDGTYFYTSQHDAANVYARIYKHEMDGTPIGYTDKFVGNHSNDITYDHKNKRVVVAHAGSGTDKKISFVNAATLKYQSTKELTRGISGIAYSKTRNMYVGTQGGECLFFMGEGLTYDANKYYERASRATEGSTNHTPQGAGCDEEYIYFPMSGEDYLYDAILVAYDWNAKYKRTFTISNCKHEIESMCEHNGIYYVNFHMPGQGSYLYKLNVALKYKANTNASTQTFRNLYLNPDGGINTMLARNILATVGSEVIVTPPTRAGYTFAGWTGNGEAYLGRNISPLPSGELSLTGSNYHALGTTYKHTDKITINLWAYMDDWSQYITTTASPYKSMRLISCTQGGGWGIEANSVSQNIQFAMYDGTTKRSVQKRQWASLAAGWHMFTMTFDGANMHAYVDGELYGTSATFTTGKIAYYESNGIFVGAEGGADATTPESGFNFKGKIRDVNIQNATVSAEDIKRLYDGKIVYFNVPDADKSLQATWVANPSTTLTLDANSGVNTMQKDSYSQAIGTALTITNPTRTNHEFVSWDKATSQYLINNQGYTCSSPEEVVFDGATHYDIGRDYMYEDAITVNVWAHMDNWVDFETGMRIVSCLQGAGFGIGGSPRITFTGYDKGIGYCNAYSASTLPWGALASGWHMFTLVFDGMHVRGYVDGKQVAQSAMYKSGKIGYHENNHIMIGADAYKEDKLEPTPYYFKGKLKNFGIVPTAISEEEVALLYANPGVTRYYFPDADQTITAQWKSTNTATDVQGATAVNFDCYVAEGTLHVRGVEVATIDVYAPTGQQICGNSNSNCMILSVPAGVYVAQITDTMGMVYTEQIFVQ